MLQKVATSKASSTSPGKNNGRKFEGCLATFAQKVPAEMCDSDASQQTHPQENSESFRALIEEKARASTSADKQSAPQTPPQQTAPSTRNLDGVSPMHALHSEGSMNARACASQKVHRFDGVHVTICWSVAMRYLPGGCHLLLQLELSCCNLFHSINSLYVVRGCSAAL